MSFSKRADRARALAAVYSSSREVLAFYAGVADWQAAMAPGVSRFADLIDLSHRLVDLVAESGPKRLAEAGRALSTSDRESWILRHWETPGPLSPPEFFARTLMQLYAAKLPEGLDCPWCVEPPLVGCLVTRGDGLAFSLVCPLCFRRRPFTRDRCPGCDQAEEAKMVTYSTPDFAHLRVKACDACKGYLLAVDLERDIEAIPEVDDLAGLPLDLWAADQGYRRLQPSIAGV